MAGPQSSNLPVLLTVGFALGLGFGWLAFRQDAPKPPVAVTLAPKATDPRELTTGLRRDAGTLADVERTFQRWGGYAVWENDVTEIALWSGQHQQHDDYYEVRRVDGEFYFRTLRRLTRPVLDHGPRGRLPVEFTEPQALHDAFHREHPQHDSLGDPVVDLPPRPPARYDRTDLVPPPSSTATTPGVGG